MITSENKKNILLFFSKLKLKRLKHLHKYKIFKFFFITFCFFIIFGIYFANHGYFSTHSRMNADEGFYAIAARSAMQGQIPYRDFAYTQMPLLPYANGLVMKLTGFGLTKQRISNIFWTALGLFILALAVKQRTGSYEPALLAVFLASTSPFAAELTAMGKSYAIATCFTCLSTAAILWPGKILSKTIAFAIFGTMAVGSRLSVVPIIFLLNLALLWDTKTWPQKALVLIIPATFGLLSVIPFILASPEGFYFFNWEYHAGSSFDRRRLEGQPTEWWKSVHASAIVMAMALSGTVHLIRKKKFQEILLLLAGLFGVIFPMIPKSAYGCYIIPAVPVAAATSLCVLWGKIEAPEPRYPFRHFLWVLPSLLFLMPFPREVSTGKPTTFSEIVSWTKDTVMLKEKPQRKPNEKTAGFVEEISDYLRNNVPPGPILTSLPIVAVEANREIWHGTHMGMFSAMDPEEKERAKRLNMVTIPLLTEAVKSLGPVAIVKLSGSSVWNFKWVVPSLKRQPNNIYNAYEAAIAKNYTLAFRSGNIELLTPKTNRIRNK